MKSRCKQRFVLFLCLLMLGEEFAMAKSVSQPSGSGDLPGNHKFNDDDTYDVTTGDEEEASDTDDDDDDTYDESSSEEMKDEVKNGPKRTYLLRQSPKHERGSQKGWVKSLFKAFKIGVKVINYGVTIVSLSASIYKAVEGCSELYPDAVTYHDDFLKQKKIVETISTEADDIQFQSELDQNYIKSTADIFREILSKLNDIDTSSETLLQTISPAIIVAGLNATKDITKLVEQKNATMEKVKYIEAAQIYDTKLGIALSVGFSALALALPAGIDIFTFSKKRYKERKMGFYELDHSVDFDISKTATDVQTKKSRFGRWIGRQQARFKTKMADLEAKFNFNFDNVKSIAKKFVKGLDIGLNLASAGYQLYETITSLTSECKRVRDTAKDAYDAIMNATKTIEGQMTDIKKHRNIMNQNWKYMRGNITEEFFLESVKTTKTVMENSANQSEAMLNVARGIGKFLDVIKTTDDQAVTYNSSRALYNQLTQVPFAFICYTNKVKIINNVVSECKRGGETLRALLIKERARFDTSLESNPGSPRQCKDDLGIDYLPDESIVLDWKETAKKEGYHEVCYVNDKLKRETICELHKNDNLSAQQIVDEFEGQLDVKDIQEVIDALPKGLSKTKKTMICNLKNNKKSDEEIIKLFGKFFADVDQELIEETLQNIDCDVDIECFPFPSPSNP